MAMTMTDLQTNWISVPLAEILVALESGSRPKGGVRGITEGVTSIGAEHLNNKGGFNFTNVKFVPSEFALKMKKGQIKTGDILIVKDGATTGKTSYVDIGFPYKDAVINEHVFICRPFSIIDSKFIFRFLMSKQGQDNILANFQGSAQGGINQSFAPNTSVPIAPINEQKHIVEKLDKLFTKVESVNERLDKIPAILKKFRQSVLHEAVTGELTKDWRANNNIQKWERIKLKDVIMEKPRNGLSIKSVNYKTEIRTLTLTATTSGVFLRQHHKYLNTAIPWNSHLWLKTNDILIQRSNSIDYVGIAALYNGEDNEFIYPDLMMKIRAKEKVNPKYILYFLQSDQTRNYFRQNATGTAGNMPKINQTTVLNTPILLPSEDEQTELVNRVEKLFDKAEKIEERYKKAKQFTDKLSQSILAKAFRGELVPQDPNDEPAEKLLERIREEREKQKIK